MNFYKSLPNKKANNLNYTQSITLKMGVLSSIRVVGGKN